MGIDAGQGFIVGSVIVNEILGDVFKNAGPTAEERARSLYVKMRTGIDYELRGGVSWTIRTYRMKALTDKYFRKIYNEVRKECPNALQLEGNEELIIAQFEEIENNDREVFLTFNEQASDFTVTPEAKEKAARKAAKTVRKTEPKVDSTPWVNNVSESPDYISLEPDVEAIRAWEELEANPSRRTKPPVNRGRRLQIAFFVVCGAILMGNMIVYTTVCGRADSPTIVCGKSR